MKPILEGIRVLDLGRYIAGPFCAALLADFGADVIRVDRVSGSEDRNVTPVAADGAGAFYLQVNRNKRSIALDINSSQGKEVLHRLIASCDVVVANMPHGTLVKLGIDYDSIKAISSKIIFVTASTFGRHGAYRDKVGFDGVAQAMSGAVHLSGPLGQPSKAMVPYVDFVTALSAALGAVAALYERRETGQGQCVEATLIKSAMNISSAFLIEESVLGPDRVSTWNRSPIAGPSDLYQTINGWIIVQAIGDPLFKKWAKMIGASELLDDPRFSHDIERGNHSEELSKIMQSWCARYETEDALTILASFKIPAGPVYSPKQAIHDVHLQDCGLFQPLDYPGLPLGARMISSPVHLSSHPDDTLKRAPLLGEHTPEILAELGYTPSEIQELEHSEVI